MKKKVFVAPEITVTVFEKADVLTLSTAREGKVAKVDWSEL